MLVNDYLENISKNESVRQMLIDLKTAIKDEKQKKALAYRLAGDFSVFTKLLSHEDPKVRKNAVQILGNLECDELVEDIWKGYCREETLFVKADYMKALSEYDCKFLVPELKKRLSQLNHYEAKPEEEKHIQAETTAVQNLILKYETTRHKFIGYEELLTLILLTNRNQRDVTGNQLEEDVKYLAAGVRFETVRLKEVMKIRTYSELLFPVPGVAYTEGDPLKAADKLSDPIYQFLRDYHTGGDVFFFRLELKGITDRDEKVRLTKKLSASFEKASHRKLVNSTSEYEVEVRLILNKKGQIVPLLKLFTLSDHRFTYRQEVLSTSIAPVNAAIMMEKADRYLKEGAQVLDPFCGTGTMLIERCKKRNCSSVYGLDILEEAVDKARVNAQIAHLPIHYINRDYFDFRHEYRFDEIVTNLPVAGKTRSRSDIETLYRRFLEKSTEIMKTNGILLVYTSMPEILQREIKMSAHYQILEECIMNEREGSICFILRLS